MNSQFQKRRKKEVQPVSATPAICSFPEIQNRPLSVPLRTYSRKRPVDPLSAETPLNSAKLTGDLNGQILPDLPSFSLEVKHQQIGSNSCIPPRTAQNGLSVADHLSVSNVSCAGYAADRSTLLDNQDVEKRLTGDPTVLQLENLIEQEEFHEADPFSVPSSLRQLKPLLQKPLMPRWRPKNNPPALKISPNVSHHSHTNTNAQIREQLPPSSSSSCPSVSTNQTNHQFNTTAKVVPRPPQPPIAPVAPETPKLPVTSLTPDCIGCHEKNQIIAQLEERLKFYEGLERLEKYAADLKSLSCAADRISRFVEPLSRMHDERDPSPFRASPSTSLSDSFHHEPVIELTVKEEPTTCDEHSPTYENPLFPISKVTLDQVPNSYRINIPTFVGKLMSLLYDGDYLRTHAIRDREGRVPKNRTEMNEVELDHLIETVLECNLMQDGRPVTEELVRSAISRKFLNSR